MTLFVIHSCQVVPTPGRAGMMKAKELGSDVERLREQLFRLSISTEYDTKDGKIVIAGCHARMLSSERLLIGNDSLFVERFCLKIFANNTVEACEGRERLRGKA